MSIFTIGWIVWALYFVILEGIALTNKTSGDTLSEHVWAWLRGRQQQAPRVVLAMVGNTDNFVKVDPPIKTHGLNHWTWRTFVVGAFLLWLFFHLTFGWFAG